MPAVTTVWGVCGSCLEGLLARGATGAAPGSYPIDLGQRCDAHGRIGGVQAAHLVTVPGDLAIAWEREHSGALLPLGPHDCAEDAELVARLAASMLDGASSVDAMVSAVRTARRLLTIARGI